MQLCQDSAELNVMVYDVRLTAHIISNDFFSGEWEVLVMKSNSKPNIILFVNEFKN